MTGLRYPRLNYLASFLGIFKKKVSLVLFYNQYSDKPIISKALLRKIYWYLFVYDLDIPHEDTASENIGGSKRLLHDITRAVLVCYLLLIFNSLIPLTADAVAHTFWKDEHIAAVHNVKGKVHVEEDLIKVSKQAEKTESSGIKSIDISLHLLPVVALSFILFFLLIIRYPILPTGTPGTYVPKTYKPPRLSPSF